MFIFLMHIDLAKEKLHVVEDFLQTLVRNITATMCSVIGFSVYPDLILVLILDTRLSLNRRPLSSVVTDVFRESKGPKCHNRREYSPPT
jgi:hypothetical protein